MIIGLAPMAGYTDYAFRLLCRECGAQLAYTEMASAEALVRGNQKTPKLLKTSKRDSPLAVQLFGAEARALCEAAGIVEKKTDWIDFNLGCPAPDLTKNGCGAALLRDKKKAAALVNALASTTKKPVSVKIRLGWDSNECTALCKAFDKAGAERIAIHGRTAGQGYSGEANWKPIYAAKKAVSCEVFGNGDIKSKAQALQTGKGLDGVLIGRAALGNPGVFGKEMDKRAAFAKWLAYAGEPPLAQVTRQAMVFASGLPHAKDVKRAVSAARTVDAVKKCFQ